MTNEIKTHRFIVTLPDVAEEEADIICGNLEGQLSKEYKREVNVEHALGNSLPEDFQIIRSNDGTSIYFIVDHREPVMIGATEAREIAGVLVAHAEDIERKEEWRRHPERHAHDCDKGNTCTRDRDAQLAKDKEANI